MKTPFQKMTQKSIITISTIGALVVVAIVANAAADNTTKDAAVTFTSTQNGTTKTVTGTSDNAAEVTIVRDTDSDDSATPSPAPSATTTPAAESNKVTVTEPSPGVTKVEGKNFTLTVDHSARTSVDEPDTTPTAEPSNGPSVNVPEDAITRWKFKSSDDQDSRVRSRVRTNIKYESSSD